MTFENLPPKASTILQAAATLGLTVTEVDNKWPRVRTFEITRDGGRKLIVNVGKTPRSWTVNCYDTARGHTFIDGELIATKYAIPMLRTF
jgi:hypothetical protein